MLGPDLTDRITMIESQLRVLVFRRFSNDDAYELGASAVEMARAEGLPVAIDIRRNGQQLFMAARPGTTQDNSVWIERKVRCTDRMGKPSLLVHWEMRRDGRTVNADSGLDPLLYAAVGGCFPIVVQGTGPIGTLTVSGLPHEEDHRFCVRVLGAYLGVADTAPSW